MKLIYKNPKEFFFIDYLVNPIPIFFILLMALNDHYLKYNMAGTLTGKLSDFCGMFYLPLLLCATYTLIANFFRSRQKSKMVYINKVMILIAIYLTAGFMMAIKLNTEFNRIITSVLNALGFKNQIILDHSDLLSLSFLPLTYWYAKQFFASTDSDS
jgi:hypothetical protein